MWLTGLPEVLDDDGEAAPSALSAGASWAAVWPQLSQGCSLKQLDLDSCTLSEILRLHILASGADCYQGNGRFRPQKQSGFTLTDDPCVELRLAEAGLLRRLATTAVYDLSPGERLVPHVCRRFRPLSAQSWVNVASLCCVTRRQAEDPPGSGGEAADLGLHQGADRRVCGGAEMCPPRPEGDPG